MTDRTPQAQTASRRQLLKGAVGAGVGLAAWGAPKIGTVPAYALTNSSGVFDGECYYISFNSTNATGNGNQRWSQGTSGGGGGSDVFSGGGPSGGLSTYTWNNVFGPGSNLVVTANGDARTAGTITLTTAPDGCRFEIPSPTTFARATGAYTVNIPAGTCSPSGALRTASYTRPANSQISLVAVVGGSGQNHVIFNIVCD